ncbi:major facilitator superfamily domain-containing protein [Xylariomycetidae sp. FL0641]|nr:major facilitator superfamily domain-containing protein [Xylariomycetidae sp. FL0641]
MDQDSDKPEIGQVEYGEVRIAQRAAGSSQLVGPRDSIRLVPTPSSNPNDPLNFQGWQRWCVLASVNWFSMMSLALIGGVGVLMQTFYAMYLPLGFDKQTVGYLQNLPVVLIGVGNFLFLPVALAIGRRPVFIFGSIGLLASSIWASQATSFQSHLGARIVLGLCTGSIEAMLLMLAEVSFVHQRGRVFAIYWGVQVCLSSLLNIAVPYVTAATSWRWYYYLFTILAAIGLLLSVFCGFETRFFRSDAELDGEVALEDDKAAFQEDAASEAAEGRSFVRPALDPTIPRHTYGQLLNPWPGVSPQAGQLVLASTKATLKSLTSPGIVYCLLLASVTLGCSISISATYSTVFITMFDWPSMNVGLINVSSIFTALFGMAYAGWFGDKFILWIAKRNGGVHQPEHRLMLNVFPAIVGTCALVLYGETAQHAATSHWMGPYMGWSLFQFCTVCIDSVNTSFAAEVWPQNPGPALNLIVGARSIIQFGLTTGIQPALDRFGWARSYGMWAGIFAGMHLLAVPAYFLNQWWRRRAIHKD